MIKSLPISLSQIFVFLLYNHFHSIILLSYYKIIKVICFKLEQIGVPKGELILIESKLHHIDLLRLNLLL